MKNWQRKVLQVHGKPVRVWPHNATLERINTDSIFVVQFDDTESYHSDLRQAILERESSRQGSGLTYLHMSIVGPAPVVAFAKIKENSSG
jgi:hypothetical protein